MKNYNPARFSRVRSSVALAAALMLLATLGVPVENANAGHKNKTNACSQTSRLMRMACYAEGRDDYLVELAKCVNESEWRERRECESDVRESISEIYSECGEQFEARQEVCDAIGQDPYDPEFEPEDFETDLNSLSMPNPYYPMAVGHHWLLSDGEETIDIEVLDETKLIDDITCFVIRDTVSVDGKLVEDTDDWFAHAKDGAIWYCGEEVKDFEFFEGDMPSLPELVSIDGSFKVEVDGARAGVSFPAIPEVGDVYRQEFSLGNAEDVAEVVSTDYSYGKDPDLDVLVPQELAELLCNDDCVVVFEYSPLEPGAFGLKYYARNVGFFLETVPEEDVAVQLIACNMDSRCDDLPDL
ncbi:MAG: hypothetical protein OEW68_08495 [Gammaproteobacteria bacterium]|nr:hypothetical protein [Gammaproteobacteria bacterium]MDH4314864.1 hypothetical protein [Gammaproteobacteria bacterium]MDH5213776.1 hypothetical protein [Gammaproteobacteria bacterium]MDH5501853.1 hypothetical protein [Gammaproteobacteria bacterium]